MEQLLPAIIHTWQVLKAIVLFGGGGISSEGISQHFRMCGNVEYWDKAAVNYLANFPNSKVLQRDIRSLTADEILDTFMEDDEEPDLIQISDPCVKKSKLSDQEIWDAVNDLGFVGLKLAFDMNPKAILCEQVPDLTEKNLAVLWAMTLSVIERYGSNYNVEARILNSHNYGDHTARRRLFIQLIRKDVGHPKWPTPVPLSERGSIAKFLPGVDYVLDTCYDERSIPAEYPLCTIVANPALAKHMEVSGQLIDLTPRELAQGSGLPDSFKLTGSISDQKRIIGNGIPFHVMNALAGCIAEVITGNGPDLPLRPRRSEDLVVPKSIQPDEKGYVVYQGPSALDGNEIVAILTMGSDNPKTGDMHQLWILAADEAPLEASRSGADASICGECSLRHHLGGGCYVNIGLAPTKVWTSWQQGKYPQLTEADMDLLDEKPIRLGAYGDPAALPMEVLQQLVDAAANHTCYTHQWKNAPNGLSDMSMASVESIDGYQEAVASGWRTYRIIQKEDPLMDGEILCPSVTNDVKCADCKLCSGNTIKAKNIAIPAHGWRKNRLGAPKAPTEEDEVEILTQNP